MLDSTKEVVLIVDDNATNLQILHRILGAADFSLRAAKSGEQALAIAAKAKPSLILLDIMMPPGIDGYEVCRRLKQDDETKDIAVIFLSALDDPAAKLRAFEAGGVDYVSKPFDASEVLARVNTHVTLRRLRRNAEERNAALQHQLEVAEALVHEAHERLEGPLIGSSAEVQELRRRVTRAAATAEPVALIGPGGSGHEAVARALHEQSSRRSRPFIYVNCLVPIDRSGLFGSEPFFFGLIGASSPGKWGLARGGTLCLDRFDALAPGLQKTLAKLLISARSNPAVDVRVVVLGLVDPASPSSSICSELRKALAGNTVVLPALCERREDIGPMVERLVERKSQRMNRPISSIDKKSRERLQAYSWPGNVSELQSVIDCAVVQTHGSILHVDETLLSGNRVGQYELLELLGEGGMGQVWSARHRLLARPAAVKLVRPGQGGEIEELLIARFEREARVTAGLESPNTVKLYDFGVTDEGSFYYVMEHLRGMDLEAILECSGPLPVERAIHFLAQACGSLAEAHEKGLVHRDIKPANLFATIAGKDLDVLKVLDFGVVRTMDAQAEGDLTAGVIVGTPSFIAPEVALGEEVDGRADLYALGCVAFKLLTGRRVFEGPTPLAIVAHHTTKNPQHVSDVAKVPIPPELDDLVYACLRKQPADRPASALALRDRLRSIPLDDPWTEDRAKVWWADNEG